MARGRKAAAVAAGPAEGPWELPDGWRWERLDAVAPVNPRRSFDLPDDAQVAFVPMAAVSELSGGIDVSSSRSVAAVRSGFTKFASGDVLFAKITPCMENGKVAIVPDLKHGVGAGSTEFHVINPEGVLSRFVFYWLIQQWFRDEAEANMTGTAGQKRVPTDYLRQAPIPVPPLDTQRRIVARIDGLFAELDDGEGALARAKADLETYRKALLKAAVTGELTADWRAANPPQETSEQLLQRILKERKARWEADPKNRGKRYKEPRRIYQESLPELPEDWSWASLGELIDRIDAGLNVKALGRPPADGETGIVKISAVTWWDFDEDASKTLSSDTAYDSSALIQERDLLISRANTLELVGAPAIVKHLGRRLVLSDKVLRLVLPETLKVWVFYVLRSSWGRTHIESNATGNQLSMRNISQDKLRDLPVPLPPSGELKHITDLMTALVQERSNLQDVLEPTARAASSLRQSILAAAFKGDLVQ
jgi:type I restriction enzyme S subunit